LDFNEARDDGVAVASTGPYANHLLFALESRQITIPVPQRSVFTYQMSFCHPTNSFKTLKVTTDNYVFFFIT